MIPEDLRTLSMFDWLENDLLLQIDLCESASSDASFRRYFRVTVAEQTFIVMDAPPEKENIAAFIKVASLFKEAKVNVPSIHQQNVSDGFLLLDDFGSQCFLDQLNADSAHSLYQAALSSLLTLQSNTSLVKSDLPHYDEVLLRRELGIFAEWFLGQSLDIDIPADIWEPVSQLLITSALEQPKVCVHRDYHSRNLMVLNGGSLGVIDFQDAVIGPITYDLVSLLRDCYVSWPQVQITNWLGGYFKQLQQDGRIDSSLQQFTRWFDLMGLQRHLKAIGIFSRLHLRDGKSGYLNDIPRTLDYVTSVCATYPELSEFNQYLTDHVLSKAMLTV